MTLDRRTFIKTLGMGTAGLSVASSLSMGAAAAEAPVGEHLPRSTPEAQGISSTGILDFLSAAKSVQELHSFMLVTHGHVVAEGWWSPYRPDAIHGLYSLSKSFTSTAVGFAVSEGKLNVANRVTHFFPDQLPSKVSDNLAQLRVRDLLTMSVGRAIDSTSVVTKEEDWVKTFLSMPIEREPGSVFLYDSCATYMLSAIIQKITGQRVIDYLKPRLFGPLDVSGMTWETCPLGINCGGWGLSVTTGTLAKFGQLYLQKGAWNGKQILPTQWVEEATTFKIQQQPAPGVADPDPAAALEKLKQTSDWYQGYCYQFWRCRHKAFRGDGAFGQYCIVMPDEDVVIAITSETHDMQAVLDLVWTRLLPAVRFTALPEDAASTAQLQRELASLALPLPKGASTSSTGTGIAGKIFKLEPNSLGAESVSFAIHGESCVFALRHGKGASEVRFGMGEWVDGKTDMPGTPPTLIARDKRDQGLSKVAAAGAWTDDNTLEMQWRYYETPHRDTVTCSFRDGQVEIKFTNSITQLSASHLETRPVLRGRILA
jgi:CubicO group peptidase (beta-lactamase class C family)